MGSQAGSKLVAAHRSCVNLVLILRVESRLNGELRSRNLPKRNFFLIKKASLQWCVTLSTYINTETSMTSVIRKAQAQDLQGILTLFRELRPNDPELAPAQCSSLIRTFVAARFCAYVRR